MSEETEICLSCGKVYKVIPEFKHRVCNRCKNAYLNGLEDAEARIIKLLEERKQQSYTQAQKFANEGYNSSWSMAAIDEIDNLLALIKGEQK